MMNPRRVQLENRLVAYARRLGRYEGDWCEGKKHGKARIIWGDGEWKGDVYEGDWVQDHRDGEGKYMWANGDVYRGRWERSKINGRGTKVGQFSTLDDDDDALHYMMLTFPCF